MFLLPAMMHVFVCTFFVCLVKCVCEREEGHYFLTVPDSMTIEDSRLHLFFNN